MSTDHRKPVVAFVILALAALVVVGVKTAEAQRDRLLATAIDTTARVHGVLSPGLEEGWAPLPGDDRPPLGPAIASMGDRARESAVAAPEPWALAPDAPRVHAADARADVSAEASAETAAAVASAEAAAAVTTLQWVVSRAVLNEEVTAAAAPAPVTVSPEATPTSDSGGTVSAAAVSPSEADAVEVRNSTKKAAQRNAKSPDKAVKRSSERAQPRATKRSLSEARTSPRAGKARHRTVQRPEHAAKRPASKAKRPASKAKRPAHARWAKASHGRYGKHGRHRPHRRP